MTSATSSVSSLLALTVSPVESVPVTLLAPYTNLRTSSFKASISVNDQVSSLPLTGVRTVSPPHARIVSVSGLLLLVTPSSDA